MGPSAQAERRHVPRRPYRGTVELAMPEDAEAYEADGVDLSIGGMSLRTSLLPDRGSELACQFKLENGRKVRARGEVVWAQDAGSDAGEFGLRFTELSDVDEDAIRDTFADAEPEAPAEPAKARLHLAGMSAPLRARIRTEMDDAIVLGSDLSFLKLGEPIEVERQEGKREKGRVEDVTIEIDEETRVARLMLTVAISGVSKTAKYGALSAPAAAKVVAETAPTIAQRRGPNATAMLSPAPSDLAERDDHEAHAMQSAPADHESDDDALDEQIAANADHDDVEEQNAVVAPSAPRTPPAWLVSMMTTLRALTTKAGPSIVSYTKAFVAFVTMAYGKIRARIKGVPVEVEAPRPTSGRRPQVQTVARTDAPVVAAPKKKLGLYVLAGAGLVAIIFAVATSGKNTRARTPRPQVAVAPVEPAIDPNAQPAPSNEAVDPNANTAAANAAGNETPTAMGEPEAGMNGPVAAPAAVAGQNFEGPDDMSGRRVGRRSRPTDLVAASHSPNANDRPTIRGVTPRPVNAPAVAAAPARAAVPANAPVAQVIGSPAVRTGTTLRMRMDGNLSGISGGVGAGNTIVIRMPGRRSMDLAAPLVRQDARLVNAGVYNRASGAELTLRFREAVPQFSARARGNTLEIVLAPAAVAARRAPVAVAAHRR